MGILSFSKKPSSDVSPKESISDPLISGKESRLYQILAASKAAAPQVMPLIKPLLRLLQSRLRKNQAVSFFL
jgi:hypothetical protein